MRLIDSIRQNPMVLDPITRAFSFDSRELFTQDTQVIVLDELAKLMIKGATSQNNNGVLGLEQTTLTDRADEFLKIRQCPGEPDKKAIHVEEFVGVIPPFDNCFFEYLHPNNPHSDYEGVHVQNVTDPDILSRVNCGNLGSEVKFLMIASVFYLNGRRQVGIDSSALIGSDAQGRVVLFERKPRATQAQIAQWPNVAVPNLTQFLMALLAMMMLGTKLGLPSQKCN
jgi:hypothetical protein